MSFPFAECVLFQSQMISALRSIFQEPVHEFSAPQTRAFSVRNEFCSQFCIPRSCAWVFRSSNVCFSQEQSLLLSWLAYSFLIEFLSSFYWYPPQLDWPIPSWRLLRELYNHTLLNLYCVQRLAWLCQRGEAEWGKAEGKCEAEGKHEVEYQAKS
jgi:hypothetical protein